MIFIETFSKRFFSPIEIKVMSQTNRYYAQVDFESTTQSRGFSNRRGYGLLKMTTYNGKQLVNDSYPQNRLQPLTTPFGNHMPPNSKGLQLESQTTQAWN